MAIEFARTHIIGRAAGHSAIKAAAYRSGTRLFDARLGQSSDYTARANEVAHSEVLLPEGAPESLRDRQFLWTAIEIAEDASTRRETAQLAKDLIVALPRELSLEMQIEMARDFAQSAFVDQGVAVDLNVHLHSDGNPHAHLMTTTRVVDEDGISKKARHLNGQFYRGRRLPEAEQLRHRWADFQNAWAKNRGIDLAVTNNNGVWQAELHRGPTKHMDKIEEAQSRRDARKAVVSELGKASDERKTERARTILANPALLVNRVTSKRAYFTMADLWRELSRHVDDPGYFSAIKLKVEQSDFLVPLGIEVQTKFDRSGAPIGDSEALYSSRKVLDEEVSLRGLADQLNQASDHHGNIAVKAQEAARSQFGFLSDEQWSAVEGVTDSRRLSVVVGFAGAGKSTMLDAARVTWEGSGYRVRGLAPSGKAAEGLASSAHFASQTIHSFLYQLDNGKTEIHRNDVFVIDESGMVNTSLMLDVVRRVERAGAKVVLIGDPEQLQPIQAGNPLRTIATKAGYHEISTIRRQREEWQQQATYDLARGDVASAWSAYQSRDRVQVADDRSAAMEALATQFARSYAPGGRRQIALAYSRADVKSLNTSIRSALVESGKLGESFVFCARAATQNIDEPDALPDLDRRDDQDEILRFAEGDRVVFNKNDNRLGVKNGSLGTVIEAATNQLKVELDDGQVVSFSVADYAQVSHGYAVTVHKAQGVTVDDAHVLLTRGWNKHLAYVAMSRHRDNLSIYSNRHSFGRGDEAKVLSEADRQQSVIDFAEGHGFEFDQTGQRFVALDADRLRARGESARAELRVALKKRIEHLSAKRDGDRRQLVEIAAKAQQRADEHLRHEHGATSGHAARRWLSQLDTLRAQAIEAAEAVEAFDQSQAHQDEALATQARRWVERQHPQAVGELKAWRRSEASASADASTTDAEQETHLTADELDIESLGRQRKALEAERNALLVEFDKVREQHYATLIGPIEAKEKALSDALASQREQLKAHAATEPTKGMIDLGYKKRHAAWQAEHDQRASETEAARVAHYRYAQQVQKEFRPQASADAQLAAEREHRESFSRIRELGDALGKIRRQERALKQARERSGPRR